MRIRSEKMMESSVVETWTVPGITLAGPAVFLFVIMGWLVLGTTSVQATAWESQGQKIIIVVHKDGSIRGTPANEISELSLNDLRARQWQTQYRDTQSELPKELSWRNLKRIFVLLHGTSNGGSFPPVQGL